jgi:2-polyprenyl-6-methoxyphenol hydroxylase-like FAD-dependent oxidoreductase
LTDYAHELGMEIRRGQELTALHQDTDVVNVQFDGPQRRGQLRARFVVAVTAA